MSSRFKIPKKSRWTSKPMKTASKTGVKRRTDFQEPFADMVDSVCSLFM